MPGIIVSSDAKKAIGKLERFNSRIPVTARFKLWDAVNQILRILRVPGAMPTYPIRWDSARQRRAFFATDGFGGGIPHVRKGFAVAGWKIQTLPNGYTIENKAKGWKGQSMAGYVWGSSTGRRMSRIHTGRWPLARLVVMRIIRTLPISWREALRLEP